MILLGLLMFIADPGSSNPIPVGPVVIAHRGASGYVPEHSIASYAMAHAMGADYIEQDLVLTRDGRLVVMHDITLDETTDVADVFRGRARADGRYYVIDFTLAEIQRLELVERFHHDSKAPYFPRRFPGHTKVGLRIPTIEEVIHLVRGMNESSHKKAAIYVELKHPAWHEREGFGQGGKLGAKRIDEILIDVLMAENVKPEDHFIILQCFESQTLKKLRKAKTRFPLVLLLGDDPVEDQKIVTAEGLAEVAQYADAIGPSLDLLVDRSTGRALNNHLVENAHKLGLRIHPWTIREDSLPPWAPTFEILMNRVWNELRVDGVFADQCDKVIAHLARLRR